MAVQRCLSPENILEEFRGYLETQRKSHHTVRCYAGDIRGLLDIDEGNGADSAGNLAGSLICELGRRREGMQISTYNRKAMAVNAFLCFLKNNGYVDFADYMSLLPKPPERIKAITADQFEKLMGAIPQYGLNCARDRAIFRVMRDTGITGEEVSGICYNDFLLSANAKAGIRPVWRGKTDIVLPISEITGQELSAYEGVWGEKTGREIKDEQKEPYFRNRFGEGFSSRSIRRSFANWRSVAGLPDIDTRALRYVFAKEQLEKGADLNTLSQLMDININSARVLEKRLKQTGEIKA